MEENGNRHLHVQVISVSVNKQLFLFYFLHCPFPNLVLLGGMLSKFLLESPGGLSELAVLVFYLFISQLVPKLS